MKKYAFSLVELSIVLVILGLLVGGVLSGQALIRAAELRTFVRDYQKFATATYTFRDKYFALPGDMANATSFWTSAGGNGSDATCQAIDSGSAATCNGNGDGNIVTNVRSNDEPARFWQHLANAGLIEGLYTGVFVNPPVPGKTFPGSNVAPAAFWYVGTLTTPNPASTAGFYEPAGQLMYVVGSGTLFFTPEEQWNIDTKVDDGKPGYGKLISFKGNVTFPCTTAVGLTAPADATAEYNFANKSFSCYPRFNNAF